MLCHFAFFLHETLFPIAKSTYCSSCQFFFRGHSNEMHYYIYFFNPNEMELTTFQARYEFKCESKTHRTLKWNYSRIRIEGYFFQYCEWLCAWVSAQPSSSSHSVLLYDVRINVHSFGGITNRRAAFLTKSHTQFIRSFSHMKKTISKA